MDKEKVPASLEEGVVDRGARLAGSTPSSGKASLPSSSDGRPSVWQQFRPFRGMIQDIKRRAPYYWTDWTLGFYPQNVYRVISATIKMFFINLMPALAYILDMNKRTGGTYGVNEGILASAMPLIIFSVFSAQPLTIVGITGLINLVNYTNYDIIQRYPGVDYLQFQAWVFIWSAIMHWLSAIFNLCDYVRYITDMTSETFGFYVGTIYIQKGIELLIDEFGDASITAGWLSVTIAVTFCITVYFVEKAGSQAIGALWLRKGLLDYAFVAGIIWWSGFANIPGDIESSGALRLPITRAFFPTLDRDWAVPFWRLEGKWIAAAIPFGFLVTLLFYFDNNVSSLMAQARQFPVKRPAGFHWDFFLLGCTTIVSGVLGLPAPNGLVPQAPVHTESLCVVKAVPEEIEDTEGIVSEEQIKEFGEVLSQGVHKIVRIRVVEQRVSHLAMGLLTLGMMTGPLLKVLGTMPRAVFAGVFILVGWGSIEGNGIVHKTLFLFRDPLMTSPDHRLRGISKPKIALFVAIQWLFYGMCVGISQTIAADGFSVIIMLLIPFRYHFGPRWFTPKELAILDAPTANSEAVLISVGGRSARVTGKGLDVAPDTGLAGTGAAESPSLTYKRKKTFTRGLGGERSLSPRADHAPQDEGWGFTQES